MLVHLRPYAKAKRTHIELVLTVIVFFYNEMRNYLLKIITLKYKTKRMFYFR